MPNDNPDNTNRNKLDTYLAEYNTLRAEQLERIEFQNQSFNYLLLVLGAAISAVVALLGKPELFPIVFWTILLLPIICVQIGFLFFDHEMAIHSIGSHLYYHLRPSVDDIVYSEGKILNDSLQFEHLHASSKKIHHRLSQSRWFLFLIPTVIPVLGLAVFHLLYGKWWEELNLEPSLLLIVICFIIWFIDLILTLVLLQAVVWTYVRIDTTGENTSQVVLKKIGLYFRRNREEIPALVENKDEETKTAT